MPVSFRFLKDPSIWMVRRWWSQNITEGILDTMLTDTLSQHLQRLYDWYGKWERPISSLSLVGGFIFDAIALPHVGESFENVWIIAHILIVSVAILLINKQEFEVGEKDPRSLHFWLENVLQFFFGGLLSVFLVFYFRSTTLSVTWPFLALLAIAFVLNERLKRHQALIVFQVSLLYFSLISFAIFFVPVVTHQIGRGTFLISGVASLAVMMLFLALLKRTSVARYEKNKHTAYLAIAGIFVAVNLLYYFNLIPPIPISLKDAGLYHSVMKDANGNYDVSYENQGLKDFFTIYDPYHEVAGEPVYAYSAVFSPGSLNITIVHEWQYYDEASKIWLTQSRVTLPVLGGRNNGFRTYSEEYNLQAGKWRVNVETTNGQIIGRLYANIVPTTAEPPLVHAVK